MRAIAPKEMPNLPAKATGWARSTKRAGSVFHAHALGRPVCGARFVIDRHQAELPDGLGSFRYHGVCPRCYKLSLEAVEA
jgi:hypothetical protein